MLAAIFELSIDISLFRLWGSHGQTNLENARICLINATIVGTETLKNMVLPGIGYFTIIDEGFVTEEDTKNKLEAFHFLLFCLSNRRLFT